MRKHILFKAEQIQLLLVAVVWLLIFATPLLFGNFEYGINWNHIFNIWKNNALVFVIFLVNRFVLMPQTFFKGKRLSYFLTIVLMIGLVATVSYFGFRHGTGPENIPLPSSEKLTEINPPPNPFRGPPYPIPPFANLMIMCVLIVGFDSSLIFFSKWMKSEQEKFKAEKEMVQNKLAFLQNQISPHFFMNTLNNIHALVDIDTDEAKEAIIRLSEIMRYMLYESQTQKIPLKREIDFIKSYVDLMRLRLTDDVEVKLDFPENVSNQNIPALLTISLIENAFKYGISYESPSFVHIQYGMINQRLIVKITNSTHQKTNENRSSGIGYANTKKRLDLLYGNNYQLQINNENNIFKVLLDIPL